MTMLEEVLQVQVSHLVYYVKWLSRRYLEEEAYVASLWLINKGYLMIWMI